MSRFLDKLREINKKGDKKLMILSVIVAVIMWAFVTTSTNPSTSRTFRNIPIIVQNQDKLEESGYTIMSRDEISSVNVRLTGSRDNILNLNSEDIQARINVMDSTEGIRSVDVKVDTPTGIYVDYIDPSSINLNIQRIIKKSLPVNVVIADSLKDGRIVELNEQKPKEIKIKGPESSMNRVDRVEAHIDEEEYLDGKIHNVPLKVLDKEGKEVEGVELDFTDVNLSFLVYETKEVKVDLITRGEVADGYTEVSRSISPETIIIKGQGQILKDVESIETEPINIGNLKTTRSGEIGLRLPEGVKVYDGEDTVNYKIEVSRRP